MENKQSFTWIPFYEELAKKLLAYKDNRAPLIEFIYADDGLKAYTEYLHRENKDRINDIDPFSFFGIFNRHLSKEKRIFILSKLRAFFDLESSIPDDFDGIPILNHARSFFFHWGDDFAESCNALWEAFSSFMEKNSVRKFMQYHHFEKRKAEATIPFFWFKPNDYIALDSNNCSHLRRYNIVIDDKIESIEQYIALIKTIKDKIQNKKIKEDSLPEFSYQAWKFNNSKQLETQYQKKNMATYQLSKTLTTNHNLILTGAPGTGKTYLAKQIAQQLIFGEAKENLTDDEQKQFDEQCGFVQFHPSYDYTDFVEGLRPIQDDNGNVGFERKDGVFKEFCKKAEKNWIDSKKSIDVLQKEFDNKELIDSFLSNAINEETIYKTKNGTEFNIADFDDDIISIKILRNKTRGNIDIDININKHKLVKLLENDLQLNNVRDIKQFFGYTNTQHRDSYIFTICNEMRSLPKVKKTQVNNIVCKNFVFIIDEINRGEISKIFGELFFSIDPGYRDKKGKVKTQYQNLVEVGDEFYDGFFVPENVYIIGTMNDIDRSVESMDFAFRRRFAFKEIKADESMKMLDDENAWKDEQDNIVKPSTDVLGKLKNRMNNLNNKIWHKAKTDEKEEEKCIDGLSSAYHIGAAYFLKLKNYRDDTDGGFENLWNNHLEGLLREYLRSSLNIEENIAKLKAAYNNELPENNG